MPTVASEVSESLSPTTHGCVVHGLTASGATNAPFTTTDTRQPPRDSIFVFNYRELYLLDLYSAVLCHSGGVFCVYTLNAIPPSCRRRCY